MAKKKKNFLNNKDLLRAWYESNEIGEMTEEFSKMIMLLTQRYSSKATFKVCESFMDDMVAYAYVSVSNSWQKFTPDKFDNPNPFAYFTTVIRHAFFQYQNHERKHRDGKNEVLIDAGLEPSFAYMVDYEYRNFDPEEAGGEIKHYDRHPDEIDD